MKKALFLVVISLTAYLTSPITAQDKLDGIPSVIIAKTIPKYTEAPWAKIVESNVTVSRSATDTAQWTVAMIFKARNVGYQNPEDKMMVVVSSFKNISGEDEDFMLWFGDEKTQRYALKIGERWVLAEEAYREDAPYSAPQLRSLLFQDAGNELRFRLVMGSVDGMVERLIEIKKP